MYRTVKNTVSMIQKSVIEKYQEQSDFCFISELMSNGLNINLNQDTNCNHDSNYFEYSQDRKFYKKFSIYSVLFLICVYQGIGSLIYWEDQDLILIVGNFMAGFRLPKFISLYIPVIGILIQLSTFAFSSIGVMMNNYSLGLVRQSIKLIWESEKNEKSELIQQIRKEIRPLIIPLKFMTKIMGPLLGFIVSLGCFCSISMSYVTTIQIIPTLFWCTHFGLVVNQLYWTQAALISIMIVISRIIIIEFQKISNGRKMAIKEPEMIPKSIEIIDSNDSSSEEQKEMDSKPTDPKTDYFNHVNDHMILIKKVRILNQSMKFIFGSLMSFAYVYSILAIFISISNNPPIIMTITGILVTPLCFSILVLCIINISFVSKASQEASDQLISMSNKFEFDFHERFKLGYILKGMQHFTTFDGSDFLPQPNNSLIIWVR